ncbi:flap endonuclease 1-like [Mizuhopecten yessoensis]|uniref:Flap endonuclease 1 n=1 Tax=Mizuhopecten yessoensis TaxID=6573 RepID=A0A210PFC9_MIZYE|nr:flap endonuclease 1-like [Mizuhopecten yessoensis]OWF35194.1 Flap endonuclease 1 [Mizuhopecten yessoensis]
MGILGLSKLLGDYAPSSMKENEIKNYFGRKVAVDGSMCIYQFLIAVRQDGNQLMSEDGETTSHIMGMFYRTIRMVENGIKPVFVFDGKPPDMKSGELAKRKERRDVAEKALAEAEEKGDAENVEKFSKRLVKMNKGHIDDCKVLLKHMGIPFIEAPGEAEAQCAALVKSGKVFATSTEDMDALTFGTTVLLRNLTVSEARKLPIKEYYYSKILEEIGLQKDEFIDLCILLGCDYCESIRGIGPKRAIDLIKQHKSIEEILKHLDTKKYTVPEDWMFKEARRLFQEPDVTEPDDIDLKWTEPDEEGLIHFMCQEKNFNEDRIKNGIKKLTKARQGTTQGRLDSFFSVVSSTTSSTKKRKLEEQKGSSKKKGRGGGFRLGK